MSCFYIALILLHSSAYGSLLKNANVKEISIILEGGRWGTGCADGGRGGKMGDGVGRWVTGWEEGETFRPNP